MSEKNMSELISSLVDGEAEMTVSDIENIKNDPKIAKKWANYHLISSVMKENAPQAIPKDFAADVMHAIAQEPVVLAPKAKTKQKAWLRPAAGFAVAATVALATIGGLQTLWKPQVESGNNLLAQTPSEQPKPLVTNILPSVANVNAIPVGLNTAGAVVNPYKENISSNLRWKRLAPANFSESSQAADQQMAEELNKLLMNHVRSAGTMQGMLPYARLAGYDNN